MKVPVQAQTYSFMFTPSYRLNEGDLTTYLPLVLKN